MACWQAGGLSGEDVPPLMGKLGWTAKRASRAVWKGGSKGSLGSGRLDQIVWGRLGCLFQCSTRNFGAECTALAAGSLPADTHDADGIPVIF